MLRTDISPTGMIIPLLLEDVATINFRGPAKDEFSAFEWKASDHFQRDT